MNTTTHPVAPLFSRFTLDELEQKLAPHYSIRYLLDIRDGIQPVRPRFRKTVTLILQLPEAELFYDTE